MTLRQAQRKAARITRSGVPTYVKKHGSGWQTRTVATQRVSQAKYQRKKRYGATPEDIARLLAEQTGVDGVPRCPLTLKPVTATSCLDHAHGMHGPDALRGLLQNVVNGIIGGTDEELIAFSRRVFKYAAKRERVQVRIACHIASTRRTGDQP